MISLQAYHNLLRTPPWFPQWFIAIQSHQTAGKSWQRRDGPKFYLMKSDGRRARVCWSSYVYNIWKFPRLNKCRQRFSLHVPCTPTPVSAYWLTRCPCLEKRSYPRPCPEMLAMTSYQINMIVGLSASLRTSVCVLSHECMKHHAKNCYRQIILFWQFYTVTK